MIERERSAFKVLEQEYMNAFGSYIRKFNEILNKIINEYAGHTLFSEFKECLMGGKRLRPLLLMLSYESCGGKGEPVMPAAVAIEILHTVSLIHDDIIDEELERRGMKPLYISAGLKSAILSADYAFSMILDLSSKYERPEVAKILSKAAAEMSAGELKEMEVLRRRKPIGLEEYLEIISLKTASLFRAAAHLGAVISSNGQAYTEELKTFGYHLGMAYQLRDDIRDLGRKGELTSLLNIGDKARILIQEMKKYINLAMEKLDTIPLSPPVLLLKKLAIDFMVSV